MFVILNDGRKVNMYWVITFYQQKEKVIYEMAKGNALKIEEAFASEEEAKSRVEDLEKQYLI